MKLKNKLFILLFVFITLFLTLNTNVFASSEVVVGEETYILPDWWSEKEYRFFITYTGTNGYISYCFIASDYPLVSSKNTSNSLVITTSNNSDFFRGLVQSPTNQYDFSSSSSSTRNSLSVLSSDISEYSYYTSHDIYNGENLVFQGPPQVETQEPTILAPIVEEAGAQKTLQEVLKILPKILIVVVSYLGLRKALKMLSALLHRS